MIEAVHRRPPDWLLRQLPVGMVQDDFFRRFVSIFQEVAGSFLDAADSMEHLVDRTVAPTPALSWLASWIGNDVVDPSLDEDVQRQLILATGRALMWRGTRRGLEQWLTVVSGGPITLEESGGVYREGDAPWSPPVVRIRVEGTGWLADEPFVRVVLAELPAHVSLELFVGERRLHPAPTDVARSDTDA